MPPRISTMEYVAVDSILMIDGDPSTPHAEVGDGSNMCSAYRSMESVRDQEVINYRNNQGQRIDSIQCEGEVL